jgi:hypothetical protein
VRGSWLGAALVAAPAAGVLSLAPLSVDVPYIDDYDALLGFLRLADETPSLGGKLRLLVEPHNEHRMLVPRLGALAVLALRGHLDFAWLNGLGTLLLLAFLGALWLGFRRGEPAAEKWLAFAPAALFLVHPQYWMVYHSPTTSLSGFTVAAAAGLAFAALDAGGGRRTLAALALAALATATLASGWLVAPLGVAVPLARRRWKAALVWGLLAAGLLAAAVALLGPPASRADPLAALAASGRLAAYTLNFVGCAAGFSQPGLSLTAGALLLAGLAAAALRGLPRKSPVLFALVLFFLASAAANALGRAQQGAGTPLLQSRYRFYSAALLALCWLSWAELLRDRRRVLAGALAAAAAFSAASFALYRGEVRAPREGLRALVAERRRRPPAPRVPHRERARPLRPRPGLAAHPPPLARALRRLADSARSAGGGPRRRAALRRARAAASRRRGLRLGAGGQRARPGGRDRAARPRAHARLPDPGRAAGRRYEHGGARRARAAFGLPRAAAPRGRAARALPGGSAGAPRRPRAPLLPGPPLRGGKGPRRRAQPWAGPGGDSARGRLSGGVQRRPVGPS